MKRIVLTLVFALVALAAYPRKSQQPVHDDINYEMSYEIDAADQVLVVVDFVQDFEVLSSGHSDQIGIDVSSHLSMNYIQFEEEPRQTNQDFKIGLLTNHEPLKNSIDQQVPTWPKFKIIGPDLKYSKTDLFKIPTSKKGIGFESSHLRVPLKILL